MKKLLFMLSMTAILFSSCTENEVKLEEQKFDVGINLITKSAAGLVVKDGKPTNDQGIEDVVRINTTASVASITLTADAAQGIETKTFRFTPVRISEDIIIDDNTAVYPDNVSDEDLNMKFWGGENYVEASTTSHTESVAMDPVAGDQDGISSNVTRVDGGHKTTSTIYGVDADLMDKFFEVYPIGTIITQDSPIQEDVKNIIRAIPPYAEFAGTDESFIVQDKPKHIENLLDLNMETQHSRITVTCRFDDGKSTSLKDYAGNTAERTSVDVEGGYYAEITPIFDNGNTVSDSGNTCPARTVTDGLHSVAWFMWNNKYSTDGKYVDFEIMIYSADDTPITDEEDPIKITSDKNLMLMGGKDIWVDMIIPADVVYLDSNDIMIRYNWDNEDRAIVVGK